jgi:hypothetical protein
MSLVTITDHNTIAGSLTIAHLPDVVVSEEVTTYFPQDRYRAHVLVYNINEAIHPELQEVRESIFDPADYLHEKGIVHVLAHPLFAVNDRLSIEHFEQSEFNSAAPSPNPVTGGVVCLERDSSLAISPLASKESQSARSAHATSACFGTMKYIPKAAAMPTPPPK